MGVRMARPCAKVGCGRLVSGKSAYCDIHQGLSHKVYAVNRLDKSEQSFYRSRQWTDTSRNFRAAHPVCQICNIAATRVAHHVPELPILIGRGLDPCDWRYLQAVCYGCHEKTKRRH